MSYGLLFGADAVVAETCFRKFNLMPLKIDAAIGIVGSKCEFHGAILFSSFQGCDVHMGYYGPRTLSAGIAQTVAQFIIEKFDPARLTLVVSKRNKRLIRSCQRFGFKLEGVQRCFYGKQDCIRNTGVRLVAFRDQIERVANWPRFFKKAA